MKSQGLSSFPDALRPYRGALPGFGRAFITPAVPVQDGARSIVAYPVALFDAEQTGAFAPNKTIVAQGQHGRKSSTGEHQRRTLNSHRRPDLPRVCGCSGASTPSSRPAGIAPTLPAGHPIRTRAVPVSQRAHLAGPSGSGPFLLRAER
jgi:hypothetical protein